MLIDRDIHDPDMMFHRPILSPSHPDATPDTTCFHWSLWQAQQSSAREDDMQLFDYDYIVNLAVSGNLLEISVNTLYGLRPDLRTTCRCKCAHEFWEGVGVGTVKANSQAIT